MEIATKSAFWGRQYGSSARRPVACAPHYSMPRLGEQVYLSHMRVAQGWRTCRLRLHRTERYIALNNSNFQRKATEVTGRYPTPPAHTLALCLDEMTSLKIFRGNRWELPLSPECFDAHDFEYYLHGPRSFDTAVTPESHKQLPDIPSHLSLSNFRTWLRYCTQGLR